MFNFMSSHKALYSNYYLLNLFLRALFRSDNRFLGSFIFFSSTYNSVGDSDVASAVINESVVEGEEARKFLENIRVTYPQVCELNTPSNVFCL